MYLFKKSKNANDYYALVICSFSAGLIDNKHAPLFSIKIHSILYNKTFVNSSKLTKSSYFDAVFGRKTAKKLCFSSNNPKEK